MEVLECLLKWIRIFPGRTSSSVAISIVKEDCVDTVNTTTLSLRSQVLPVPQRTVQQHHTLLDCGLCSSHHFSGYSCGLTCLSGISTPECSHSGVPSIHPTNWSTCLDTSYTKRGVLCQLFATVYGIWNMDFFRTLIPPICLPLTTIQVIALDYLCRVLSCMRYCIT